MQCNMIYNDSKIYIVARPKRPTQMSWNTNCENESKQKQHTHHSTAKKKISHIKIEIKKREECENYA